MGFIDFFTSLSDRFSFGTKSSLDNKLKYKVEGLKADAQNAASITVGIERDLQINSVLSVLDAVTPKISKVVNYRTIKPEHGKVFLRKGIQIHHTKAFKLKYNGLLAQSGAPLVFAVTGTGDNENWQDIKKIPMYKVGTGFEALVPYTDGETSENDQDNESNQNNTNTLNIAFTDAANNWDNNYGNNYSFNIELLKGKSDKK